ncbi:hypothetical protein QBZ16_003162 [Prototheca wickerhamii]|uniref:Uncharacterized protein n=1 Tax=Prototheca wickerhamii TaxID=3111 RepID=A0AAD9MLB7_PROWI|nr:hypothetical protein QBZ16_003162 [Prototheca wickerhamii]
MLTLAVLVRARARDVPLATLAAAVGRAGAQIDAGEVAQSTTALRLAADALRARPEPALSEAAAAAALPGALALTAAPLLRPETCRALEEFFGAFVDSGHPAASFEALCDAIAQAGARDDGAGVDAAARCIAALCAGSGGAGAQVLDAQLAAMEARDASSKKLASLRLAFRVVGGGRPARGPGRGARAARPRPRRRGAPRRGPLRRRRIRPGRCGFGKKGVEGGA